MCDLSAKSIAGEELVVVVVVVLLHSRSSCPNFVRCFLFFHDRCQIPNCSFIGNILSVEQIRSGMLLRPSDFHDFYSPSLSLSVSARKEKKGIRSSNRITKRMQIKFLLLLLLLVLLFSEIRVSSLIRNNGRVADEMRKKPHSFLFPRRAASQKDILYL